MVPRPKSVSATPTWVRWILASTLVTVGLWFFPLFHVVPISPGQTSTVVSENPAAAAEAFWSKQLPSARADDAARVASALMKNPKDAVAAHAHQVGLGGTAYFFVRG